MSWNHIARTGESMKNKINMKKKGGGGGERCAENIQGT